MIPVISVVGCALVELAQEGVAWKLWPSSFNNWRNFPSPMGKYSS